jgi:hypothetical protein
MRRMALLLALLLPLPAPAADMAAGLSQALVIGTQRVVEQLGRPGSFLNDARFHIPLPSPLDKVRPLLAKIGLGGLADDLEVRLNHAAEAAMPAAGELLVQTIRNLSFQDAAGILTGPSDAATRYLERQTGEPLAQRMRPVVEASLAETGAVKAWDVLTSRYGALPFMPDLKADLTGQVVSYAKAALFDHLGAEEARIRADPAARTTELLRQVFGG